MEDNCCWGYGFGDQVPEEAIAEEISHNSGDVHITRVALPDGELQPAMVVNGTAYATFNGKEILVDMIDKYPVLIKSRNMRWKRVQDRNIPQNALKLGRTKNGEPLYVTRVRYPYVTDIAIGKVQQNQESHYPYSGKERCTPDFDVLTVSK